MRETISDSNRRDFLKTSSAAIAGAADAGGAGHGPGGGQCQRSHPRGGHRRGRAGALFPLHGPVGTGQSRERRDRRAVRLRREPLAGGGRQRGKTRRQAAGHLRRRAEDPGRQVDRRREPGHAQPLARAGNDLGLPGRQGRLRGEARLAQHLRGPQDGRGGAEVPPHRPARHAMPLQREDPRGNPEAARRGDRPRVHGPRHRLQAPRRRPQPVRPRAEGHALGPLARARLPWRRTISWPSNAGGSSRTTATARSATRASTSWTSSAGGWDWTAIPRRCSRWAETSSTRTTKTRPPTRSSSASTKGRKLLVQFETREWYTNSEAGMGIEYPFVDHHNVVGVIFFGTRRIHDHPRLFELLRFPRAPIASPAPAPACPAIR